MTDILHTTMFSIVDGMFPVTHSSLFVVKDVFTGNLMAWNKTFMVSNEHDLTVNISVLQWRQTEKYQNSLRVHDLCMKICTPAERLFRQYHMFYSDIFPIVHDLYLFFCVPVMCLFPGFRWWNNMCFHCEFCLKSLKLQRNVYQYIVKIFHIYLFNICK